MDVILNLNRKKLNNKTIYKSNISNDFPSLFSAEPLPLMDLCRRVIRQKIGRTHLEEHIHELALPHSMKTYLLYKDRR